MPRQDERGAKGCCLSEMQIDQDTAPDVRICREDRKYRRRRGVLRELRRYELQYLMRALTLRGRRPRK